MEATQLVKGVLDAAGALSTYVVPSEDGPRRKYHSITPRRRAAARPAARNLATIQRGVG